MKIGSIDSVANVKYPINFKPLKEEKGEFNDSEIVGWSVEKGAVNPIYKKTYDGNKDNIKAVKVSLLRLYA